MYISNVKLRKAGLDSAFFLTSLPSVYGCRNGTIVNMLYDIKTDAPSVKTRRDAWGRTSRKASRQVTSVRWP